MTDLQQLTVTLNAKIDQFKSGMAEAVRDFESSAGKIDTRNQQLSASISKNMNSMAESTRFLAGAFKQLVAVATLEKIASAAVEATLALSTMATTADRLAISTDKIQEIGFAGKTLGGLGQAEVGKGLQGLREKAATELRDEPTKGEGELGRLFSANNLKLTDRNGKLKDGNQLLLDAATLVSRAGTELEALQIAQKLGLPTDEWVKLLSKGPDAIKRAEDAATRAGAIIDSELIQKAKEFDEAWNQGWSKFAVYAKSAAAEALGYLGPLLTLFNKLPGLGEAVRGVSATVDSGAETVDEAEKAFALQVARDNGQDPKARQLVAQRVIDARVRAAQTQQSLLLADDAAAREIKPYGLTPLQDQPPMPPATKIPGAKAKAGAESTDDFERAYNQLLKQKEGLESQAKAEGLVGRAYDEAVASEKIFQAAQEAGIKLTAAQTAEVHQLAGQYADLKQQLAGIKFDKDIKFDFQQLGRTKDEQAVFADLRGRGIDEGSEKFQKAADELRTLHGLTDAKDTAGSFLKGMITDLENGVKAGQALENQLKRIADKLLDKTIDAALSGLFGSGIGKIFGFGGGGGAAVPSQAGGGWIGSGPMVQADPRMWLGARAFAQGGGVPVLAHAGEIILNQAQQKNIVASMAGGQAPAINVNHAPVINGVGLTAEQVAGLMAQNNKDFTRRLGTAMDSWNRKFGRGFG
jgi:hypothetical protein